MKKSFQVVFKDNEEVFRLLNKGIVSPKAFLKDAMVEYFLDENKRVKYFYLNNEDTQKILDFIRGRKADTVKKDVNNQNQQEGGLNEKSYTL